MDISNTTNMSFRVDRTLKKKADALFRSLGLNTSVALNMFLVQCVREQGIPFTPKIEAKVKKDNKLIEEENFDSEKNIDDLL